MTYDARKICNFLLSEYDPDCYELTNLRINKLLFLIHGWSLARTDVGLVKNRFEAWRLGPVVRVVFDSFKTYGRESIRHPAEHLDYESGTIRPIAFDDVLEDHRVLIRNVVEFYASHSTSELVSMLHEHDGPWDIVITSFERGRRTNAVIPEELIRAYFRMEDGEKLRH